MEQARGVRAVGIGAAAALDHRVERIEHRAVGGILRHGEALPLDGAGCPATGRTATGRTGNPWAARQALASAMENVPKWKIEAASTAEAWPPPTPSASCHARNRVEQGKGVYGRVDPGERPTNKK